MIKVYRHGEITFQVINKLPKGLKKEKTKIIVQGSHGNAHSFDNGSLYFKKEDAFTLGYFVAENTTLFHTEHGKGKGKGLKMAKLPNGVYKLLKQQEHTPQGLVPVID